MPALFLRGTKKEETMPSEGLAQTRVEISDCQSRQGIQNRICTEE